MQENSFLTAFVQKLIVNEQRRRAMGRSQQDGVAGLAILLLVPGQRAGQLAAIGAEFAVHRALALIDPELLALRVIADMTGLDDHQILAVMGVRAMAVGRHPTANQAMIERKGAEVSRQQD